MIENLVPVPDRAPLRMAFKGWMSSLPCDLCKLMRLLSDQIVGQILNSATWSIRPQGYSP